jgi:hypothetical protein
MISLAIGIAGLVAGVLCLRAVAYRWMEKERRYQSTHRAATKAIITVDSSQREFEFVPGEVIQVGRLVHR